jgi:23S rRNA G2445 N2-methylase RlmL
LLERADIRTLTPGTVAPGLLLANLPYGKRLGNRAGLQSLFEAVGEALHTRFAGWRAALLTDQPRRVERALGLRLQGAHELTNGGMSVSLLRFGAHAAGAASGQR